MLSECETILPPESSLPLPNHSDPLDARNFVAVAACLDTGLMLVHGCRVLFANPAAMQVTGTEDAEDALRVLLALDEADPAERGAKGVWRRGRRGERILEYTEHALPGDRRCLLVRDATARARLESIAQAINTTNNLGFVVAGLRHELGNPLNALKMTLSVLRKNLDVFPPPVQREYVERSLGELARIESLLKSLKTFNLYESCEIVEHDLGQFLDKFLLLVRRDLEQRGVQLHADPPPPGRMILADQRVLQQALLNLLANAVDALEGCRDPWIVLSTGEVDGLVHITVADNGRGISPAQIDQLFRPFCTTKPHGNGLGLVITRELLARMHAGIEVESREGRGTAVTITLSGDLPGARGKEAACPRY